ncbi:uncharacterized protein ASCRUDRAFT_77904 [Ascoidea rubescens DSM 1968]|uniref:Uncharacterized protein n=1 Tax=Ascoidea rubescens DSM 1968 TaxID=1344418 RepID=A0A1D2VA35_9ASCO|nr:hypothetical protein ASCRUDRAFT_77904 [Ascoidea rubescens DSM 1968]ODV58425.1 hypothetical protein ASCRUDRAFT_77904 [Ascoidea rubescens DSM 1968]
MNKLNKLDKIRNLKGLKDLKNLKFKTPSRLFTSGFTKLQNNVSQKTPLVNSNQPITDASKVQFKLLGPNTDKDIGLASVKDVFQSPFSMDNQDEELENNSQNMNFNAVINKPELYMKLNVFEQNFVKSELSTRQEGSWSTLTIPEKKFLYWLSYGNWGPREGFQKYSSLEPPEDIPFKPHQKRDPSRAVVRRLKKVNLRECNDYRRRQNTNPLTNVVFVSTIVVSLIAVFRDKFVGEPKKALSETPENS